MAERMGKVCKVWVAMRIMEDVGDEVWVAKGLWEM